MSLNFPQALQSKGLYYGYVVLIVGTIGLIASIPGQTMGISVFTEHLVNDLNIDRLTLSLLYLSGTLSSAFVLPLAGRLLDRIGARLLAVIACLGLAAFLVFLAHAQKAAVLLTWLTGLSHSVTILAVVYLGFFGIRHFGQGQLTIASRTMMGRWFVKKRGLVLGISGMFVAFAFGVSPYLLNLLITEYLWQMSLYILAVGLLGIAVLAYGLYRESPEASGLIIDGGIKYQATESDDTHATNTTHQEISFSLQEAKATLTFWVFNLGLSSQALIVTGITFNIADIGFATGMNSAQSFSVFIYISIIAVISQFISGYLSDRIAIKYILAVMQASLVAALLGLHFFGSTLGFSLVAGGLGISSGIFSLLTAAAWPKLFGRLHLGAINGFVSACMVGASAIGPYLLSQGKAMTGDYHFVLYGILIVPAFIFVLAFFITTPQKTLANN